MLTYRLVNDKNDEIIFGIDNKANSAVLGKLKKGIALVRPYNHVIPHYKGDKFSFISLNAFKYFLFYLCDFEYEDIKELESLGYSVTVQELDVYCKGLSKLLCTYFDNEVVELKSVSLSDIFKNADSCKYTNIRQHDIEQELINDCKEKYYKDVKFKD